MNGYALGGGFELSMICDMIIATDSAKFGLPELSLGTIPGSTYYFENHFLKYNLNIIFYIFYKIKIKLK